MLGKFLFFVFILLAIAGGAYFFYGEIPSSEPVMVEHSIAVPANLSRKDMANVVGDALSWGQKERESFPIILAQMQWLAFGTYVAEALSTEFGWSEEERETFLISTVKYLSPTLDPLEKLYIPDTYVIPPEKHTVALVAGEFIERVKESHGDDLGSFVAQALTPEKLKLINDFVHREQELLPDLVPLPPQDVVLVREKGKTLLRFSTTYYNQGKGVLELRADPKTAGIRSDVKRNVYQRIYQPDNTYRERISGSFLWHQEHLHYHFEDFATYDLEALEVDGPMPNLDGIKTKSTFCIRDVSKATIDIPNRTEAKYLICGKEIQGISVGWGDTYFYNYADQLLDVTDLPSGKYKLTFVINPADRFDEYSVDNNTSSAVLDLDMKNVSVKVLEESPKEYPDVEHVYPNQNCSNCVL